MSPSATCPTCLSPLDANGACAICGARASSGDLVAKAEALFVSYLAARIVHARQEVNRVRRELFGDPRSRARIDAVERAEQELSRLQAQLVAQTRESQRAQRAAEQAHLLSAESAGTISAATAERKCPRCGAAMPGVVTHCRCGYVVEITVDSSALFSTEPGVSPNKPGKTK